MLAVATVVEAFSLPLVSTLLDKLVVLVVDPQERARIMGLLFVLVILLTTPFGWIGGQLSKINRALPFVLLIGLFLIGTALTLVTGRLAGNAATSEAEERS
jgi:hypothetical protein